MKNHFCVSVCIYVHRHPVWPSRPLCALFATTILFLRTFCVLSPTMRTFCVFIVKWYQITWCCSAQNECAIFATRTMCDECAPISPIVQCTNYHPHFLRVHPMCTYCVSILCRTYCAPLFAVQYLYNHSQNLSEIIALIDWSIFVQQNEWSAIGAH